MSPPDCKGFDFYWTMMALQGRYAGLQRLLERPTNPLKASREIEQAYHNRRVLAVNDHEIRMSVMTHPFPWHRHPDSDESFHCLDGELVVEFTDGEVTLRPGEFLTVAAGVRHRTRPAGGRSVNLTFERMGAQTVFD